MICKDKASQLAAIENDVTESHSEFYVDQITLLNFTLTWEWRNWKSFWVIYGSKDFAALVCEGENDSRCAGWRRVRGCLIFKVIFRKRALTFVALAQEEIYNLRDLRIFANLDRIPKVDSLSRRKIKSITRGSNDATALFFEEKKYSRASEDRRRFPAQIDMDRMTRGGGLGSRPIFKKFHEPYAPS